MIYLAPIQGFTDFVYREAYSQLFTNIDTFFIPYISVKNNKIIKRYEREIIKNNNPQKSVVPQVLAKDTDEMLFLSSLIEDTGYNEINLNLGCPFPMVTNRGKGAGFLPHPEKLRTLLSGFFENSNLKLSIKLRAGLNSPKEIESIIPVLNDFPLTEIIFHPRIAKQLYKGEVNDSAFEFAIKNLEHRLVYNGDIFTLTDYEKCQQKFPETDNWMIGRGVLMNPFLPVEISNISVSNEERIEKLKEFHRLIIEGYTETMDNAGNILNKMKQFWSYFSFSFPNQKKVFKAIKKSRNLDDFNQKAQKAFFDLY